MSNIDFKAINDAALKKCPQLLEEWLPGGKLKGREYVCGTISGGYGKSFSVNIEKGVWKDFEAKIGGKDIVSLYAAINKLNQYEAARELAKMLGLPLFAGEKIRPASVNTASKEKKTLPIMPIPDNVPLPDKLPAQHWIYKDVKGRILGILCRFDSTDKKANGKPEKSFTTKLYTEKGWINGYFPAPYPFYNLHTFAETPESGAIIICEGEKAADALQGQIGHIMPVLGLYGGTNAIPRMNISPLQGRKVIYWPDNDKSGIKAALSFAGLCNGQVASFHILKLPDRFEDTWDAWEAINKLGWKIGELKNFINTHTLSVEDFKNWAKDKWEIEANNTSKEESINEEDEDKPIILPKPAIVPITAFPDAISQLLQRASECYNVPLQIPTACLLGLLSALVGRSRTISFKPSWKDAGNVWIAIVAKSGMGKTPVLSAFFRPLEQLEYNAKKSFDSAYNDYEIELDEWNSRRKKTKGKEPLFPCGPKPEQPILKQVICDDITMEALGDILKDNAKGVIWLTDELSGLIADLGRYTNNKSGAKARLTSSYDCRRWKVSRSSNPKRNIDIPKACVSIFGGLQPGLLNHVFEADIEGYDIESGLLPRFIFIRAEQEQPDVWNETILSSDDISLLERICRHLWEWNIEIDAQGNEIEKSVPVSLEAKAIYEKFFNEISIEAFLSENASLLKKLRAQVQRICLLLHCLDAGLQGLDGMTPITADCMKRALLLAGWIKKNQEECWQLFLPSKNKAKQPEPLERAIMEVIVENADTILANKGRITNADLCGKVRNKIKLEVSNEKIGKTCTKLNIPRIWIGHEKGKQIDAKIIFSFEKTVGTVVTVGKQELTPISRVNGNQLEPLEQLVKSEEIDIEKSNNYENTTVTNGIKTNCRTLETSVNSPKPTDTTDTTVTYKKNINFDKGDDIPDEVII